MDIQNPLSGGINAVVEINDIIYYIICFSYRATPFILRPCPLCRTSGAFVPVSLTFEESFGSGTPSHVFNPCGHVASLEVYYKRTLFILYFICLLLCSISSTL